MFPYVIFGKMHHKLRKIKERRFHFCELSFSHPLEIVSSSKTIYKTLANFISGF